MKSLCILFLNGALSMMVVNPEGKIKDGNPLGTIIPITEKNEDPVKEPGRSLENNP